MSFSVGGFVGLLALCVSSLLRVSHAGYTAWCKEHGSDQWTRHDTRATVEPWRQAPLSQAQLEALQMQVDDPARFLIGGRGQGHVVGIPSTIDGGGCTENSYCMWMCQALCCLAKDCKFAGQQTREDSECCEGDFTCMCTVEMKYRWCYLNAGLDTLVKSNNAAVCENDEEYTWPEMTGQCKKLVESELGLNVTQANYIASLGGTSRKHQALSGEDKSKIMDGWKPPKQFLIAQRASMLEKKLKNVEKKMAEKVSKAQKKAGGAKKWYADIADKVCSA